MLEAPEPGEGSPRGVCFKWSMLSCALLSTMKTLLELLFPPDPILYHCFILQLSLVFLLKNQKPILLAIIFHLGSELISEN